VKSKERERSAFRTWLTFNIDNLPHSNMQNLPINRHITAFACSLVHWGWAVVVVVIVVVIVGILMTQCE